MKRLTATVNAMLSLWMLLLLTASASGISVKFGTSGGPIVPPTPEPKVVPVPPFREPAPVWEERPDDLPDPNVTWRPLFFPNPIQPLYTRVGIQPQPSSTAQAPTQPPHSTTTPHQDPVHTNTQQAPAVAQAPAQVPGQQNSQQSSQGQATAQQEVQAPTESSAQRFVNAYLPRKQVNEAAGQTQFYNGQGRAGQTLSSLSVPGVGLRYFAPAPAPLYAHKQEPHTHDSRHNHIDNNEIEDQQLAGSHDAIFVYEKEAARRARHSFEGYHTQPVYYFQWPVYIPHRNY